jgi:hypothetical protein
MMEAADAARTVAGMEGGALDSAEPCSGLVGEGRGSYRQRLSCIAVASSWATGSGSPESPAKVPCCCRCRSSRRWRGAARRGRAWGGGGPGGTRGHGAVRSGRRRGDDDGVDEDPAGHGATGKERGGAPGREVAEQRRGGEAAGVIVLLARVSSGRPRTRQGAAAVPTAA